jgi:KDO2-lipid IV(A) lauroyltransferase
MSKALKAKHQPPTFRWSYLGPRFWPTWMLLGFLWLIAQFPVRINLLVGQALGWVFYKLAPSRRHIAATNLRLCFPDMDETTRAKKVRAIIESIGISFLETAMALWGPANRLRACHSITGLEHLEAAQKLGKGVVLLTCHMTTIDMCARMLAFHTKFHIFYRQDPNPLLAYMLVKAREQFNYEGIITVETRKLVNQLRSGRIVWYAPDQDYGIKHSIFAPFFGIPAATVPGTGRFARLGNALVIPFFQRRDEQGHYHIKLGAPLDQFPSGDDLADCTRVNKVIEQMILVQPDQYLWVHRRFKTRPVGEPGLYARRKEN